MYSCGVGCGWQALRPETRAPCWVHCVGFSVLRQAASEGIYWILLHYGAQNQGRDTKADDIEAPIFIW